MKAVLQYIVTFGILFFFMGYTLKTIDKISGSVQSIEIASTQNKYEITSVKKDVAEIKELLEKYIKKDRYDSRRKAETIF